MYMTWRDFVQAVEQVIAQNNKTVDIEIQWIDINWPFEPQDLHTQITDGKLRIEDA